MIKGLQGDCLDLRILQELCSRMRSFDSLCSLRIRILVRYSLHILNGLQSDFLDLRILKGIGALRGSGQAGAGKNEPGNMTHVSMGVYRSQ